MTTLSRLGISYRLFGVVAMLLGVSVAVGLTSLHALKQAVTGLETV